MSNSVFAVYLAASILAGLVVGMWLYDTYNTDYIPVLPTPDRDYEEAGTPASTVQEE